MAVECAHGGYGTGLVSLIVQWSGSWHAWMFSDTHFAGTQITQIGAITQTVGARLKMKMIHVRHIFAVVLAALCTTNAFPAKLDGAEAALVAKNSTEEAEFRAVRHSAPVDSRVSKLSATTRNCPDGLDATCANPTGKDPNWKCGDVCAGCPNSRQGFWDQMSNGYPPATKVACAAEALLMKIADGPGCQGDNNQIYGNHCGSKWSCGRNIAEGDSCPFHCGVGARQGGCLGDSRNNDNGGIACPQCNCHDPDCRKNNGYLFHKEADDLCAFVDDLTDTSDVAQPIDDIDSCCAAHDFCCRDPIMANGQKLFAGQTWSWRHSIRTVRQPSTALTFAHTPLPAALHAVASCSRIAQARP